MKQVSGTTVFSLCEDRKPLALSMKKTYGAGSVVFITILYLLLFAGYSFLLYRLYTHGHSRHVHVMSWFSVYIYAILCLTFVTTLYYFISRYLLHYQIVVIQGDFMKIIALNPFLRPIITTDNISRVHIIANKTRPELTVVTPEGEINMRIATNYLALYNLYETFIATGVPVYVSGPSARYFKMDKRKLRGTVFIIYAVYIVLMLFFMYRVIIRYLL
jgi:hypothetical protein